MNANTYVSYLRFSPISDTLQSMSISISNVGIFIILQSIENQPQNGNNQQHAKSTKSHVLDTGVNPLLTAHQSFLFHPLLLGAAPPPVAPVRRSPTNQVDSSASTNLRFRPLLLQRGQRPPRQPPVRLVVKQSSQRVLAARVLHRSRSILHLSSHPRRPTNSRSVALLFYCTK